MKRLSRHRAKPLSGSGFKSLPRNVTTNGRRVAKKQRNAVAVPYCGVDESGRKTRISARSRAVRGRVTLGSVRLRKMECPSFDPRGEQRFDLSFDKDHGRLRRRLGRNPKHAHAPARRQSGGSSNAHGPVASCSITWRDPISAASVPATRACKRSDRCRSGSSATPSAGR